MKDFDPAATSRKKKSRRWGASSSSPSRRRISRCKVRGLQGRRPKTAERTGVYIGSGIGGFEVIEREHKTLLEQGPRRISPFFIPATIVNLASRLCFDPHRRERPNSATATACTTSAHSIGDSFRLIQHGDADVDDLRRHRGRASRRWASAGSRRCARFRTRNDEPERASPPLGQGSRRIRGGRRRGHPDAGRTGAWRKRRGAQILAEIVGYGMSGDAYHITAPPEDGDGAFRVMRNALRDAGIEPHQMDYINAHGTSTPTGRSHRDDRDQARLRRACLQAGGEFHEVDDRPSAGRRGRPGSRHHGAGDSRPDRAADHQSTRHPDEDCDLDYVPNHARPMKIDYALSNRFGFGGTNGCLIFKKVPAGKSTATDEDYRCHQASSRARFAAAIAASRACGSKKTIAQLRNQ